MKFRLLSLVATLASLLMFAMPGGLGIVRADELVSTGYSECKTVEAQVEIPASRFRCWNDEKKDYIIPPGKYVLEAGSSSADIRQTVPVTVEKGEG
jgi:hypothetical protein